jgi:hypothetical protein
MKRFAGCLILILPILAGCKGQLAGVKVNLAADGGGDCEVGAIRDVQVAEGQAVDGQAVLQNATEVRSVDLRVHQLHAKFASINDLKIGDISFTSVKEDGTTFLTIRIPAAPTSKWFGAFGVSERSLETWNRIEEDSRKTNEARRKADPKATNLAFEAPKPPNVLFEINLPTKLEGQGFETVPLGLTTKITTDHGERQASLSFPLAEIHANKIKEVIWKIRYPAQ